MIVLVGGSLGPAQWLVLRRCVHHAAWWILVNVLNWGIVTLVIGGTVSSLLDLLAFALVPGIATSVVLWLLLDKLPQCEAKGR